MHELIRSDHAVGCYYPVYTSIFGDNPHRIRPGFQILGPIATVWMFLLAVDYRYQIAEVGMKEVAASAVQN